MYTEPIVTQRLLLKTVQQEDAFKIWTIWGDTEMGKYLHDPYYETPKILYDLFSDVDTWSDYSFVAYLKDSHEFIGTCSLGPESKHTEWGLGYCVHKSYWGNGYATEMANALIEFGYSKGIYEFTATVAKENISSSRVMEKIGMTLADKASFAKKGTDIIYESLIYKKVVTQVD